MESCFRPKTCQYMLSDEISTSVDSCTREDHRRASYAKTRHEFNNRLSTVGMGRSPGTQKMYLISSHITTSDLLFPSIGPFYFRSWSSSRQISDSWPTIRKAWFLGTKLQFAEVDLRSSIFSLPILQCCAMVDSNTGQRLAQDQS